MCSDSGTEREESRKSKPSRDFCRAAAWLKFRAKEQKRKEVLSAERLAIFISKGWHCSTQGCEATDRKLILDAARVMEDAINWDLFAS